jgi:hypothetical protein
MLVAGPDGSAPANPCNAGEEQSFLHDAEIPADDRSDPPAGAQVDDSFGDIQSVRISPHRRRNQRSVCLRWDASTTITRCAQLAISREAVNFDR